MQIEPSAMRELPPLRSKITLIALGASFSLLALVCSAVAAIPYTRTGSLLDTIMIDPEWSLLATAINSVVDPDVIMYLQRPTSSKHYV